MAGRVFLVAGEPSGDRHAARLVRELLARRPELQVDAYGLEELGHSGARLLMDMRELAVMWFLAVAARLPTFVGLLHRTFMDWRRDPPGVLVLVDYPGLNLLLARHAHRRGIPVVYYIPPQLWAWAPWRRRRVARWVDQVLTILPFECEFFADAGVPSRYVGHPLGDDTWAEPAPEGQRVVLLPGSRTAELQAHLDLFLKVALRLQDQVPELQVSLVVAKESFRDRVQAAVERSGLRAVELLPAGEGREALRRARLAIAKSGTTTLEVALAGVPMVVVYRVSRLGRWVGRMHMTSPYVALANVVAGRELAPEFLVAGDASAEIAAAALELCQEGPRRAEALAGCRRVREYLARPGAAAQAAEAVLQVLDRSR